MVRIAVCINYIFLDLFLIFFFFFLFSILQCAIFLYKGLAGLTETFRFLTETSSLSDIDKRVGTVAIHCS